MTMYLNEIIIDKERMRHPSHNISFPAEQVAKSDRVEVWSSSFSDSGPDFNEFKLRRGGEVIAQRRQEGY